jgi:hypothetical protein
MYQLSQPVLCFTICLCISPDLDGYRYQGNKNETLTPRDRFIGGWPASLKQRTVSFEALLPVSFTICFTICLFISPDLDG